MKSLPFAAAALIAAGLVASEALAARPAPASRPACSATESRPLEFWLIGRDAGAMPAEVRERRRLRAVLDGCAISEHWSSAAVPPAGGDDHRDPDVRRVASAVLRRRVATARTAAAPP
ncbi:hypothetical protein [Tahibacter caeni]|uniref:hypothetical protein n=1 Tax=Tahibacter caeni TaxID=1453545 RepID=UPI00214947C5|nr:hypothetical protein [Tahibacter caeni]